MSPAVFWKRTRILLQQLDELYKLDQDRGSSETGLRFRAQKQKILPFSCLPSLAFPSRGLTKGGHTEAHCQEHRLVFKFSWSDPMTWDQDSTLHACIEFCHQSMLLQGGNWSNRWKFSKVWYCIAVYTHHRTHKFYWWMHIRGYLSGGRSFQDTWSYTLAISRWFLESICLCLHSLPETGSSRQEDKTHAQTVSGDRSIVHGCLHKSSRAPLIL